MRALGVTPLKPANVLSLGDEGLLRLSMTEAASRYGVSDTVIAKRLRLTEVQEREVSEAAYV